MTDKDKELLIVDLCGRLPYGVIVDYKDDPHDWNNWVISDLYKPEYSRDGSLIKTDSDGWISYTKYDGCGCSTGSRALRLDKCKPYLRPLSSMTDEEMEDYAKYKFSTNQNWEIVDFKRTGKGFININCKNRNDADIHWTYQVSQKSPLEDYRGIDWLNEHMFDYRGLIDKGLALEAPGWVYRTTIHVDLAEEGRDITVEDTYQDGKLINSKIL